MGVRPGTFYYKTYLKGHLKCMHDSWYAFNCITKLEVSSQVLQSMSKILSTHEWLVYNTVYAVCYGI